MGIISWIILGVIAGFLLGVLVFAASVTHAVVVQIARDDEPQLDERRPQSRPSHR